MFTLVICQAYWLGICVAYQRFDYPTEEACYRAAEFVLKTSPKKPATVVCQAKEAVNG
jgi:hypothetical protein